MNANSRVSVVLVNDEVVQRNTYATWLRSGGYVVRDYESANDALYALRDMATPELIVTDLFMPGIDGWRFCRLLKSPEFAWLNDVPVLIASTTYSGEDASRITRSLGAALFLPLPVSRTAFLAAVRGALSDNTPSVRPRVLLVEDSEPVLEMMRYRFDANGYETITAVTGLDAREILRRDRFDCVVLDNHLPDSRGDEILEDLGEALQETAFIMVTANPNPNLAVQWMKKGASGYVKKPLDPAYLVELCEKARRERSLMRIEYLLEERTRQLTREHDRYRMLLHELQHRVKNSMMMISSLISIEKGNNSAVEVQQALDSLEKRVSSIAGLYSLLNETEDTRYVALDQYIRMIADSLSTFVDKEGAPVLVRVQVAPLRIAVKNAVVLGLITTELVTNAVKHGDPSTEQTSVDIALETTGDEATLAVRTRESTLPEGFPGATAEGSGIGLVQMLTSQLGGVLTWNSDEDTVFYVTFPVENTCHTQAVSQ